MNKTKIGFIGLGNVGGKLAGNLARLAGLGPGKIWLEMSTTDSAQVRGLGALVETRGGSAMDCPVSGGCHRAETGNLSIFAGGPRSTFEAVLPVLSIIGRRILRTGALGSASILKVVTNYLIKDVGPFDALAQELPAPGYEVLP